MDLQPEIKKKAKSLNKQMYEQKASTAQEVFGGICFVCKAKYKSMFVFHHLEYKFGEFYYKDFKDTTQYNLYVIPIVRKEPERFLLLCRKCHTTLERLKRWRKDNMKRLLLGLFLTK